MKRFIKKHRVVLIVIVLALLGASYLLYQKHAKSLDGNTVAVKQGNIVESVYGIGTVTADKTYSLKVGVSATIQSLAVKEGFPVKKGDVLLTLEGPYVFRAPFSGVVTSLPNKAGDTVFSQVPILTLVDREGMYLLVSLEQRGAILIKPGQLAKLSFENMRDQTFEGRVAAIYSNDDKFLVRLEPSPLPESILPDMTADVAITVNEKKNVLLIPVAALNMGKVRVKNGTDPAKNVDVKVGVIDGDMAEITSPNIHAGDMVLVSKGS